MSSCVPCKTFFKRVLHKDNKKKSRGREKEVVLTIFNFSFVFSHCVKMKCIDPVAERKEKSLSVFFVC